MNNDFSQTFPAMFVTDFDGTLFHRNLGIHEKDLESLFLLREAGIVTALATGRSFGSLARLVKRHDIHIPVDYLILSSGALILKTLEDSPLLAIHLESSKVQKTICLLDDLALDFMVYAPYPDSGRFYFRRNRKKNPDFDRRLGLNSGDSLPLTGSFEGDATEIVSIVPSEEAPSLISSLRKKLSGCNIIRRSSPFGTDFTWIEIFPGHVSKASGATWLADRFEIPVHQVVAMGNDYNDEDLLAWASLGLVTEEAPLSMKKRFSPVPGPVHGSVSAAIREIWKDLFL